jgi:hypothetical protein
MMESLGYSSGISGATYRDAYRRVLARYEATPGGADNKPHLEILDNQADRLTKDMLKERGITYQLVPPHNHRRNHAERDIRTAQNQMICAIQDCDPEASKEIHHLLIPQCEDTLNMLRSCNIDPTISAYQALYGTKHDWSAHPMAPPGAPECHL